MPTKPATVARNIYFYRIDAGNDDAGRPLPFDTTKVLSHIKSLPFKPSASGGRYQDINEGTSICCWIDRLTGHPCIRFASIRRSDLPHIEEAGKLSSLSLPETSGLAESIHLVFFPDRIVGAEYNHYGPRISRFRYYAQALCPDICPPIYLEPLIRQDTMERLERLGDVRMFQLRARASYASTVAKANKDLGTAFKAAVAAGSAEDVEVILRPKRKGTLVGIVDTIKSLFASDSGLEGAKSMNVTGVDDRSGRSIPIDCLSGQLVSRKPILRVNDRSRTVDSKSAYEAIMKAYDELKDDLQHATGVRV